MLGGISIWQLAIILVIVILIFGTKKLRNLGGDVGSAVKNFKSAMDEGKEQGEKDGVTQKVADASEDSTGNSSAASEKANSEKANSEKS